MTINIVPDDTEYAQPTPEQSKDPITNGLACHIYPNNHASVIEENTCRGPKTGGTWTNKDVSVHRNTSDLIGPRHFQYGKR